MIGSTRSFNGLAALAAVSLLFLAAEAAEGGATVEAVELGFNQAYKPGHWCLVRVKVTADEEGFRGFLVVRTTDPDDIPTLFGAPGDDTSGMAIAVAPGKSEWFRTYARPGTLASEVVVELWDRRHRVVSRGRPPADRLNIQTAVTAYVLGLGTGPLLDPNQLQRVAGQAVSQRGGPLEVFTQVLPLDSNRLPNRWLGYDTVDAVILSVDDNESLARLGLAEQRALRDWVHHGGTILVGLGSAAPALQDLPLGELIPVEVEGTFRLRTGAALEEAFDTPHRLPLPDTGIDVPRLKLKHGRALVTYRQQPLVVEAAFGFGRVVVLALPLNHELVRNWEGRHAVFASLLHLSQWRTQAIGSAIRFAAVGDLSADIKQWIETFETVRVIPFQWVLFLIFGYILLIGPVDYVLVRRVLKRPELTWITFPAMALLVSALAWFAAVKLKGNAYQLKELYIVDVDSVTRTARGTGFGCIFAPAAEALDVRYEPGPPLEKLSPAESRLSSFSWFGIPDDAIGGYDRSGALVVVSRPYRHRTRQDGLDRVPVHAWSAKTFQWTWAARDAEIITGDLEAMAGFHLSGTIENRSPLQFTKVAVVFNRRAYVLPSLPPGAVARVEDGDPVSLSMLPAVLPPRMDSLARLTFYRYYGDATDRTNFTLHRLDLTHLMESEDRAIVLAFAPNAATGRLRFRAREEITPQRTTEVLARIVLPVRERRRGSAAGENGGANP